MIGNSVVVATAGSTLVVGAVVGAVAGALGGRWVLELLRGNRPADRELPPDTEP